MGYLASGSLSHRIFLLLPGVMVCGLPTRKLFALFFYTMIITLYYMCIYYVITTEYMLRLRRCRARGVWGRQWRRVIAGGFGRGRQVPSHVKIFSYFQKNQ